MKVETTTHLVAETEAEAKILADEFHRLHPRRDRATKMWKLTLPAPKIPDPEWFDA